ncbi:hypothetical protein PilKf_02049 [Pillotina sp. SPG140]
MERRENIRYPTEAHAIITTLLIGEAILQDISITGCCIEYTVQVPVSVGEPLIIKIIPEPAAGIGEFTVIGEPCWIRSINYSCEIGFLFKEYPKGKFFERYVDYLSYKSQKN